MKSLNRIFGLNEAEKAEINDKEILRRIKNLDFKDNHQKECLECGLHTDFIFSDGKCEFCTTKIKRGDLD